MTYFQPLFPVLLILTIYGTARCIRTSRDRLFTGLAFGLFLISWPPFAWLAAWPLESGYSAVPPCNKDVQAIVVLSSAVFPPAPPRVTPMLGQDTTERCQYAAWLYKHCMNVPILASGGGSGGGVAYSVTMRDELRRQGVPDAMISTEEQSRSTYENATKSAEILRRRGIRKIALVTDAYHMRRAEKCFEKQGFQVVAAPCSFRAVFHSFWPLFSPGWEAISWNEDTLHEAIALVWYGIRGRT